MIDDSARYNRSVRHSIKIEEISTDFELLWNSSQRKEIESFIQTNPAGLAAEIVRELTAVECELRMQVGEKPCVEEYLLRFPAYGGEVAEAFEIVEDLAHHWTGDSNFSEGDLPNQIGDYRIVRRIGHGGMGIVYEAIQESLDRKVAIKTLIDHPLNIPRKATRFRREARAVAKLHHNNIVHLFGSGVHNGIPYFAMQLIDGQSIDMMLRQAKANPNLPNPLLGPQRFANIAKIGNQVANALQYAHEQGILHRDIKPSNLIIDDAGKTWVSDFGLAKLTSEPEATNSIDVVGTLRYLPPEAINGDWNPVGDIYSLGLTLYELLALNPAYPESDRIVLLSRKSSGNRLRRIGAPGGKIPADLENIICKATDHQPGARYANAGQFADDLARFLNGESTLARPDGPLVRIAKWSKRRKALAALCFTMLAVAIGGIPSLTYLWLRSENALNQLKSEQAKTAVAREYERKALAVAEDAFREAEAATYGSSIQLAHRYHIDGNVSDAERILDDWLPSTQMSGRRSIDRRGWEWYYLYEQLDDSILTLSGDKEYVWSVAISADNSRIATVHGPDPVQLKNNTFSTAPQCEVIVWDAKTGDEIHVLRDQDSNMFGAAFSPDSTKLVTFGTDFDDASGWRGNLIVWDLNTGKSLRSRKLPGIFDRYLLVERFHRPYTSVVKYSKNGKELITAPDPIEILDAENLESVASIEQGLEFVELNDGNILFIKRSKPGVFKLIRQSGMQAKQFATNAQPQDIAASNDDQLISLFVDRKLQVRELKTGEIKFELGKNVAHWAHLDPSGQSCLYSTTNGVLKRKEWLSGDSNFSRVGHKNSISSVAFNGDSSRMVTGSLDGTAKVWDINKSCNSTFVQAYSTGVRNSHLADIEFTTDGNVVYMSRSRLPEHSSIPSSGTVGPHGAKQVRLHTTYYAIWPRTDFDFSPNGKLAAAPVAEHHFPKAAVSYCKSSCIGIWSTENWKQLQIIDVAMTEIRSVAWNTNNRYLAVAGINDERSVVRIFERERDQDGKLLDRLKDYPIVEFDAKPAQCLAFRDNHFAAAYEDRIMVWTFVQNPDAIPKVSVVPHRHLIVEGEVRYLDFAPDSTRIAAAVKDKASVAVFDLDHSALRYNNPAPRDACCVRFSPNGRRIAVSGYEGTVFLYDSDKGNRLLSLKSCDDSPGELPINSRVIFSSDGRQIATNNYHGHIVIWKLPPNCDWNSQNSQLPKDSTH